MGKRKRAGAGAGAGADGSAEIMSEKKRRRITALEQRLSNASPATQQPVFRSQQEKRARKPFHQLQGGKQKSADAVPLFGTPRTPKSHSYDFVFPEYQTLLQPVSEQLVKTSLQPTDTIKSILYDLFKRGDAGIQFVEKSKDSTTLPFKYINLGNSCSKKKNKFEKVRDKALQQAAKRSKKHISLRQHRKLGSFNFPKKYQRYELFLEMHKLWKEQILEMFRTCSEGGHAGRFPKADLHGAILAVVESANKTLEGLQGIMVRETWKTLGILTSENKFYGVPKESVFMCQLDDLQITFVGNKK